jgi:membrane protease subunit (stomatin/prohibitin family)
MGLWDKLVNELVDIIEWTDDSRDTMVWRFPRYQNEIKYGAKLVVRESQAAAFVNEGKLADVYTPGTFTLTTQNMPILTTLMGWKYGFNSPFKAEVYFVNTRVFTDRKWGTKNPIMMRDAEFGMVRVRAFGTFAIRVKDVPTFLRQITGTDRHFTVEEIGDQLRDLLVSRFADAVAEAKIPVLDLAAHYTEIGEQIRGRIQKDFDPMGIEVALLAIENISLPPEVEQAIDKRTSMGVIGNMGQYTQYQTALAIGDAAKNPGGIAGVGAGMGAGFAMANQMAQAVTQTTQNQPAAPAAGSTPPPLPQTSVAYYVAVNGQQTGPLDLGALQQRIASGQITQSTLVWKVGMPQWSQAGGLPELSEMFAPKPPPIPQ